MEWSLKAERELPVPPGLRPLLRDRPVRHLDPGERSLPGLGQYPAFRDGRLCGGYTTFSSFSLQTLALMRTGATLRATAKIALTVLLCVGAVALGPIVASQSGDRELQIAQATVEEKG